MFYGWGRSSRDWPMRDGRTVVAVSRYLSIMFIPLIISTKWSIIGDVRSQDAQVSRDQIEQVYGDDAPSINLFSRFGLLFVAAAFFLFVVGASVIGSISG